jgi:site-specific DNA-methyltransferase (adenine-specific)
MPVIKEKIGGGDAKTQIEFEQSPHFGHYSEPHSEPHCRLDGLDGQLAVNWNEKINNLPYKFIDAHKLDKKIDIKKSLYGSKLDAQNKKKREDYFAVKEIINPELIRLNSGLVIRLIGIKQRPDASGRALNF